MQFTHGLLLIATLTIAAPAQTVKMQVDAAHPGVPYRAVWNYFGADEPNYTYAPDGTQLLGELSQMDPATPVYFRPHNLLTSGDGEGSLKWGSTGVYREAPDGSAIYDWTITDKLFDNLVVTHIRPMVEIGFMPEALSPHPTPYRHSFPKGEIFTGWSYPPKDYAKWRALIVAYVEHLLYRYGTEVERWKWEVWNEPDIRYFHGSVEEYEKLYDITTGAIHQVLPTAFVGGPAVTGPSRTDKDSFLWKFLDHCAHGINADTGKPGVPLDFISFHPKGSPAFEADPAPGHVRMSLAHQLRVTDNGFKLVASFPEFRATPIILSESDPEGCAACQGPRNGYRNGTLYGVSVAENLARTAELARLRGVNLQGAVTWAFEFEGQPWFAGFRDLATNGVDKPVLNVFRLFARLSGNLLPMTSSANIPAEQIEASGVGGAPDIGGIATRDHNAVDVILWNYHDADLPAPAADVTLAIDGIRASRVHVAVYRVDHDHGNAYTAWLAQGSPEHPTAEQVAALKAASHLEPAADSTLTKPANAALTLTTQLPRQAVVLYRITW